MYILMAQFAGYTHMYVSDSSYLLILRTLNFILLKNCETSARWFPSINSKNSNTIRKAQLISFVAVQCTMQIPVLKFLGTYAYMNAVLLCQVESVRLLLNARLILFLKVVNVHISTRNDHIYIYGWYIINA
jgi:hypothetical protein